MTLEQLNTALYEKIYAEQQQFISSLKTMPPENIIDYLMRVRGMTFIEAVSQIANDESALRKQYEKPKPRTERNLIFPSKAENNDIAIEYLKKRGINEDVISYFIENDR